MRSEPIYIDVSPPEEMAVRGLGAQWDAARGSWFIPAGVSTEDFEPWLPDDGATASGTAEVGPVATAPPASGSVVGQGPVSEPVPEVTPPPGLPEELKEHARNPFPEQAFAPLPTFVAGKPPEIDPEVADAVFHRVESPAAQLKGPPADHGTEVDPDPAPFASLPTFAPGAPMAVAPVTPPLGAAPPVAPPPSQPLAPDVPPASAPVMPPPPPPPPPPPVGGQTPTPPPVGVASSPTPAPPVPPPPPPPDAFGGPPGPPAVTPPPAPSLDAAASFGKATPPTPVIEPTLAEAPPPPIPARLPWDEFPAPTTVPAVGSEVQTESPPVWEAPPPPAPPMPDDVYLDGPTSLAELSGQPIAIQGEDLLPPGVSAPMPAPEPAPAPIEDTVEDELAVEMAAPPPEPMAAEEPAPSSTPAPAVAVPLEPPTEATHEPPIGTVDTDGPAPGLTIGTESEDVPAAALAPVPVSGPDPVAVAEPEPVADAEIEPEPEPVTVADAEIEPEPVAEVEPEPVAEVEPEPVVESEPVAEAEPEPEPVADVEPEPVAESEPEPEPVIPVATSSPFAPPVANMSAALSAPPGTTAASAVVTGSGSGPGATVSSTGSGTTGTAAATVASARSTPPVPSEDEVPDESPVQTESARLAATPVGPHATESPASEATSGVEVPDGGADEAAPVMTDAIAEFAAEAEAAERGSSAPVAETAGEPTEGEASDALDAAGLDAAPADAAPVGQGNARHRPTEAVPVVASAEGATSLSALPEPADGRASVYVVGMLKRCYSCGEQTRVIAGVLINRPESADDESAQNAVRKRRKVNVDRSPKFQFIPLSGVVGPLRQELDSDWYRAHQVGPIEERQMDEEYRWSGDVAGVSNGCVHCDAMLRDYPIQDAFQEAIGTHRDYTHFAFATIELPVEALSSLDASEQGEAGLAESPVAR